MIWIPNEADAWEPAHVLSNDAKSVNVKLRGGKEVKIAGPLTKYDSIPAGSLDEECDNLVNLENFSEGIILHHVRKRFGLDEIYTFVGSILIAVNPYKSLNIYDLALVDHIYTQTKLNGAVPPHVFSIGAAAVYHMRYDNKDQSVLISGTAHSFQSLILAMFLFLSDENNPETPELLLAAVPTGC
jgi:myosin heavy subunit